MGGGKSRNVGSSKSKKGFKQLRRAAFQTRHVDQVWEDVRKPAEEVHKPGKQGPLGTTAQ
jgi:hypothetical protein